MQSSFALAGTLQVLKQKGLLVAADRPQARLRRLQRRHPRGAEGHRRGQDRRHRLPAGRPVRQVRPVLPQGRDRRQDVQARPDRPRQHDHPGPRRACWRTSSPHRWSPPTAAPTAACRASRATTSPCGATTSADAPAKRSRQAVEMSDGERSAPPRPPRRTTAARRARPSSRRRASSNDTVRPWRWTAPGSPSGPARPTRWSAATAPASRPWCRSSPACRRPDAGDGPFGGEPGPAARRPRRLAAAGRLRLPEVDDHPRADRRREPLPEPARPRPEPAHQLAARCAARRSELLADLVGGRRPARRRPAS